MVKITALEEFDDIYYEKIARKIFEVMKENVSWEKTWDELSETEKDSFRRTARRDG